VQSVERTQANRKHARGADADISMSARAAWLHYAGGLTQAEVARRLGVNNLKAHRLITKANQEGIVKVFIDGDVQECVALEDALTAKFDLDTCEVVPDFDDEELPLRALGMAGAQFLKREIDRKDINSIGVGHGRTLASCIDYLPSSTSSDTEFVSLLGGLTSNLSAAPHDVIYRLSHQTGAKAFVLPVPFCANTGEDREIFMAQRGLRDVYDLGVATDLKVVGIGTTEARASLIETGMVEQSEIKAIAAAGGYGEILGHYFDAEGNTLRTPLTDRIASIALDDLMGTRVVAIAGGEFKIKAIRSALKSGYLSGLVTDERTATQLIS